MNAPKTKREALAEAERLRDLAETLPDLDDKGHPVERRLGDVFRDDAGALWLRTDLEMEHEYLTGLSQEGTLDLLNYDDDAFRLSYLGRVVALTLEDGTSVSLSGPVPTTPKRPGPINITAKHVGLRVKTRDGQFMEIEPEGEDTGGRPYPVWCSNSSLSHRYMRNGTYGLWYKEHRLDIIRVYDKDGSVLMEREK